MADKKGNKWQLEELFKTGVKEIDAIMKYVKSIKINISYSTTLDFGCGVGRLTQPLADHFNWFYGVDIVPSMIELANKYNPHGERCKYILNETSDFQ